MMRCAFITAMLALLTCKVVNCTTIKRWGQCGNEAGMYTNRGCEVGTKCTKLHKWYWQCIPVLSHAQAKCPRGKGLNLMNKCGTCPPGKYNAGGNSACTLCPPGTMPTSDRGSCKACSEGFFSPGGKPSCLPCPPGSFSLPPANGRGAAVCTKCSSQTAIPPGDGRPKDYLLCSPGAPTARKTCHGDFVFIASKTCCGIASNSTCVSPTTCPRGRGLDAAGTCTKCGPGFYSGGTDNKCSPCDMGYESAASREFCTPCPPLTFNMKPGTTCNSCPRGTFSYSGTFFPCEKCTKREVLSGLTEDATNQRCDAYILCQPGKPSKLTHCKTKGTCFDADKKCCYKDGDLTHKCVERP